ncbi:hypothetical protein Leryth_017867 [Lithospermum erythrorhizon]|nr:hypothetical protein Leryth_017867 [Lithospermum erythrorhizon]
MTISSLLTGDVELFEEDVDCLSFSVEWSTCFWVLEADSESFSVFVGDSTISLIISFMETGETTKSFFTRDSFDSDFVM